ncbi:MAG: adenylate/guanylate cyclase domain-containing protein [Leptospiraceae bacterium]|nr:adenylate/guanylate cyclase domain-containing protein [Leptospiraceae bacterium]
MDNIKLSSFFELTEGIQDIDLNGIAQRTLDNCMTSCGITSGVFFIKDKIIETKFHLYSHKGFREIRQINQEQIHASIIDEDLLISQDNPLQDFIKKLYFSHRVFESVSEEFEFYHLIKIEESIVGFLFFVFNLEGEYSIEDTKTIRAICSTSALSIKTQFQMEELRDKYIEMDFLKEASARINEELKLDSLSKETFHETMEMLCAKGGLLISYDDTHNSYMVKERRRPVLYKSKNLEEVKIYPEFVHFLTSNSKNGKVYYLKDEFSHPAIDQFFKENPDIHKEKVEILIAMIVENQLVNLCLAGDSIEFPSYDGMNLSLLTAFLFQARTAYRNALLFKREEELKSRFQKYVPEKIVEDALTGTDSIGDGFKKQISILFSDIRSFTTLCEEIKDSKEIVKLLNEYFHIMLDVIDSNGGILDKLIGDAIMATWGIFDPKDNYELSATRAANAAIGMIKALEQFNQTRIGLKPLEIGIGLHFGEVHVGNVGGTKRMDFTIIGDSVNLAARLESETKKQGVSICVSSNFYELIKEQFVFNDLGNTEVKGKSEIIKIYELVNRK